jgi:hypothetical protein
MSLDKDELFKKDVLTAVEEGYLRSHNLFEAWEAAGESVDTSSLAQPGASRRKVAPESDVGESDDGYESMGFNDLRDLAKKRDVSAGGSAAEIIERLRAQDSGDSD